MPTRELQVIRRISDIIARTADYEEGLRETVKCVARRLHVDACSVFVHDEARNALVLEATYGLSQDDVHSLALSVNEGITGQCFRTGKLVNAPDKYSHPAYMEFKTQDHAEHAALLAVPLMVGGRVTGVLDFELRTGQTFHRDLIELVQAIASPLAVFILNAKLAQQVERGSKQTGGRLVRLVLKGQPITEGIVRGRAHYLPGAEVLESVSLEYASNVEAEKALFHQALDIAREETSQIQKDAEKILAEADAGIFFAHLLLLEDPTLIQRIHQALDRGFKLSFALKAVTEEFGQELEQLDNEFMRERLADMKDVILRIYQAADRLTGLRRTRRSKRVSRYEAPIIVAHELLPSQLMRIPLANLGGVICEEGSATTHVAILAKALRVPMIAGAPEATRKIRQDDDLILDCSTGSCYVRPSQAIIRRFRPAILHYRRKVTGKPAVTCARAVTTDNVSVRLGGNVSLIGELPLLEQYGAMGIGLYRTEFMFMIRGTYPGEDEQYSVFRRVVEAGGDSPVNIRVLDVGGDKPLSYVDFSQEINPYLGWRGIRFLLSNPQFLEPHLRAILRTTVHGKVNVLLPMVADLDELLLVRDVLDRVEQSLDRDGVPYSRDYRLGIMLEVPSALWALPDMLPYIDFVSIGTNDLTQYVFAVDRGNTKVARWYRQFHPVLLEMIRKTCAVVHSVPGKEVALCGEIAGKPLGVPFLLGLGLRDLSMNPWKIPQVRAAIRKLSIADCEKLAEAALACRRDADVVAMIDDFADEHELRGLESE